MPIFVGASGNAITHNKRPYDSSVEVDRSNNNANNSRFTEEGSF